MNEVPKVKLTIGRVFSWLVATEPHWPRISSILQIFLRCPLSCFSPKIHLQGLWKRFKFDLDQNLDHFEGDFFWPRWNRNAGHIVIRLYSWPWTDAAWTDGETPPAHPRPPCASSFVKSGLIRILHQYFTHCLHVYAGETIMPPRVLVSGPKPCGGKKISPRCFWNISAQS